MGCAQSGKTKNGDVIAIAPLKSISSTASKVNKNKRKEEALQNAQKFIDMDDMDNLDQTQSQVVAQQLSERSQIVTSPPKKGQMGEF